MAFSKQDPYDAKGDAKLLEGRTIKATDMVDADLHLIFDDGSAVAIRGYEEGVTIVDVTSHYS